MWTDESMKKIEEGMAKALNGVRAALPTPDEAARELRKLDEDFERIQKKVRKNLEQGIRRTARRPL